MLKKRITEDEVVQKFGDENIFKRYFGDFNLGTAYNSVFREDRHPSTGFFVNEKGRLVYMDFATDAKYSCVEFVQKLYALNYGQAIQRILEDFKDSEDTVAVRKLKPKGVLKVELTVKGYSEEGLKYWADYYISKRELEDNFIYEVRDARINDIPMEEPIGGLRFAYLIHYKGEVYTKIYSPLDEENKWKGNVKGKPLFGFDELPYASDTLIITKGQKDRVIFKKFFSDVVATQLEAATAVNKDDMEYFLEKYENIWVCFDADETGSKAAIELCKKYKINNLTLPDVCYREYGVKDAADLMKQWGEKGFKKWMKKILN